MQTGQFSLSPLPNTYNLSYVLKCSLFGILSSAINGRLHHTLMHGLCPHTSPLLVFKVSHQTLASQSFIFVILKGNCPHFLWTATALPSDWLFSTIYPWVFPCPLSHILDLSRILETWLLPKHNQHPSINDVLGCVPTCCPFQCQGTKLAAGNQ